MIPTLFGILLLNFLIIHLAPGGPIERIIAQFSEYKQETTPTFSQPLGTPTSTTTLSNRYIGAQGLDPAFIKSLEVQFGFDKPMGERFFLMMKRYLTFDLGNSFYKDDSVIHILLERLPVSISLGLWTILLIYLISIPLGIQKAVQHHSRLDIWTSVVLVVAYATPAFLIAILFVVLFSGGSYFNWFPLRGLVSDNWEQLSKPQLILDYFWHITLPVLAMAVSGLAKLTFLTKNSFLEEIHKQYVLTARAKGLSETKVLYGHVFRNAMLIVIAGLPHALMSLFFTSSMLIEIIFSLKGLGLLGFEAATSRDFPVLFGSLYVFTLMGLVLNLLGDLLYMVMDPRIHFGRHAQ